MSQFDINDFARKIFARSHHRDGYYSEFNQPGGHRLTPEESAIVSVKINNGTWNDEIFTNALKQAEKEHVEAFIQGKLAKEEYNALTIDDTLIRPLEYVKNIDDDELREVALDLVAKAAGGRIQDQNFLGQHQYGRYTINAEAAVYRDRPASVCIAIEMALQDQNFAGTPDHYGIDRFADKNYPMDQYDKEIQAAAKLFKATARAYLAEQKLDQKAQPKPTTTTGHFNHS